VATPTTPPLNDAAALDDRAVVESPVATAPLTDSRPRLAKLEAAIEATRKRLATQAITLQDLTVRAATLEVETLLLVATASQQQQQRQQRQQHIP